MIFIKTEISNDWNIWSCQPVTHSKRVSGQILWIIAAQCYLYMAASRSHKYIYKSQKSAPACQWDNEPTADAKKLTNALSTLQSSISTIEFSALKLCLIKRGTKNFILKSIIDFIFEHFTIGSLSHWHAGALFCDL